MAPTAFTRMCASFSAEQLCETSATPSPPLKRKAIARDDGVTFNKPGAMVGRVTLREDRTLFRSFASEAAARRGPGREDHPAEDMRMGVAAILDRLDASPELYFDRVSQICMPRWSRAGSRWSATRRLCRSPRGRPALA